MSLIHVPESPLCFIGDTGTGHPEQLESKKLLNDCTQVRHLGDIVYQVGIESVEDKNVKEKFLKASLA